MSLLELLAVLMIAGALLALAAPRLAVWRDAAAVRGASSELAGLFSLARATAVAQRTTVAVLLDTSSATVTVRSTTGAAARHTLGDIYGVRLASDRDSAAYDARGLGAGVSNITVIVARGRVADTLTLSRMGRVRW